MPLPTHRLALAAMRSLRVDAELSPLVRRSFSLTFEESPRGGINKTGIGSVPSQATVDEGTLNVLQIEYRATTNRMLRVAVNGFMESLGVVLGVMEELDVDVLAQES